MVTKGLKAGTFKEAKLGKTRARREDLARERRIRQTAVSAGRNDFLPELRLCEYRISELAPPRRRTRKDNAAQIERVAASIAEFGFSQPILIRDGIVIDGWIRVLAAQKLGLERVPVIVCDHLDDTQARALSLAVNRIGELGEWDLDQLKIEFEELIELEIDLDVTGFSAQEQDIILLDPIADGTGEADACEEPPDTPVSRIGDVWHLGDHRIICGNALEEATYTALLNGTSVHAVLSDFPYNVRIKNNVSGLGKKVHDEFVMASGELSDDEWQAFLDQGIARLTESILDGSVLFVFMDFR
ncbi:site-specific DNA-methyltransferase [Croceicoccus ponticola]|uniref:Site-specific DNA-methyltransferase n=1 Tax=Croceicoccus ponticola TaxID=2217664 RepID=A0A437GVV3_9SPHN|nr:ParB/Srx family N-terminal domain-containing protein [Croceicoccus ponticola]RVQ66029.1 site-specific DNA-methyltransferase [Croceicoccus ponticola]